MNRRFLSHLLVVSALGSQLLNAQAPATATNSDNTNVQATASSDALTQLKARIAEQQEQIKKLQQAVDEQQKMLEQTLAKAPAATNTATASATAATTTDGTAVVTASNTNAPVSLVPAVNVSKPEVAKLPRYMQDAPKSPLSINIGGTTFTPFGFIDAIAYARSTNPGSGLGSSFASIPYNNAITGHIGETNISLQNSRLGFRVGWRLRRLEGSGLFGNGLPGQPAHEHLSNQQLRYVPDAQRICGCDQEQV